MPEPTPAASVPALGCAPLAAATLVGAALFAAPRPQGRRQSDLAAALAPLLETRRQVADTLDRLAAAGEAARIGRGRWGLTDPGRAAIAARLGIAVDAAPGWTAVRNRVLIARALAPPVADPLADPLGAWIAGADGLKAAVLLRAYRLPGIEERPSLTRVRNALVWARLAALRGRPAGPIDERPLPVTPLALVLLADLAGADPLRIDGPTVINRLAAAAAGARRADPASLRSAVLRRAVAAAEGAPPPPVAPEALADFAARVRAAAAAAPTGRVGAGRVFISEVWRQLQVTGGLADLALDLDLKGFKAVLVSAHQSGHLTLSRADLVAALDPAAVAASLTRPPEAMCDLDGWHFVRLDR